MLNGKSRDLKEQLVRDGYRLRLYVHARAPGIRISCARSPNSQRMWG